jgi:hypothetical protein
MTTPQVSLVVPSEYSTIQDDVERLIEIAAQLFSALERQIHGIEVDLLSTLGENLWSGERTVFKEQLIQTATNLDTSLRTVAEHLGHQVEPHSSIDRLRMSSAEG